MTPKLSPKKTVEGAIGGVVGAAVLGFTLGTFFRTYSQVINPVVDLGGCLRHRGGNLPWWEIVASAIGETLTSKRITEISPGHGGMPRPV